MQLFKTLIQLTRKVDPDILLGYEIQSASWGYLSERAHHLKFDFCESISRLLTKPTQLPDNESGNTYLSNKLSELATVGRLFLNVWKLMKHELSLTSYTLENLVYHILHKRVPKFSHAKLTEWYKGSLLKRWKTLGYFLNRVQYTLMLMQDTNLIGRTRYIFWF